MNAIVKQLEAVSKSRGDFVRKILGMHYFSVDIPKKELNKYDFSSLSDKLLQDLKGEHTVKWPSLTQKNNFSSQTDPQLLYLKVIKKIGGGELQTCNDLTTAALAGLNDSDLFRYFPVAMKEKIHCLRDKKFGLAEH